MSPDAYTLSYRWTDSAQKELGTQDTQLDPSADPCRTLTVTRTVTATSKTDSTQVLTGSCRYGRQGLPGTTVGAAHARDEGERHPGQASWIWRASSLSWISCPGDGDSADPRHPRPDPCGL